MPKQKTSEEAYKECNSKGEFKDQEIVNKDKVKTMLGIAKANIEAAETIKKKLDSKSPQWCAVYTLYYDALRELVEALVAFDKKKIFNHQCLFAYLCEKYKELDLDWNFFEKIRTKRNGINYYGVPVGFNDFREIELQLKLYIKTLEKAIKEKIQ
mgnify:CR=1 FL=1